jgi:aminopeptidase N
MEETSGQPLGWFFDQWLTRGAYLTVDGSWRYDAARHVIEIELAQTQDGPPFEMPLEIGVTTADRPAPAIERVRLSQRRQRFTIGADTEPSAVTLDPNVWLLMDATITRR